MDNRYKQVWLTYWPPRHFGRAGLLQWLCFLLLLGMLTLFAHEHDIGYEVYVIFFLAKVTWQHFQDQIVGWRMALTPGFVWPHVIPFAVISVLGVLGVAAIPAFIGHQSYPAEFCLMAAFWGIDGCLAYGCLHRRWVAAGILIGMAIVVTAIVLNCKYPNLWTIYFDGGNSPAMVYLLGVGMVTGIWALVKLVRSWRIEYVGIAGDMFAVTRFYQSIMDPDGIFRQRPNWPRWRHKRKNDASSNSDGLTARQ